MRKYKLPLLLGLLLAGIISVWLLPAILRALPTRYAMRLPEPLQALALPADPTPILPTVAAPVAVDGLLGSVAATTATPPASPTPLGVAMNYSTPTPAATLPPTPTATQPPTATPWPIPVAARLTGFTHVFQEWNNCGPATMVMALTHFGRVHSQRDTALVLRPNPEDRNVTPQEMADFVNTQDGLRGVARVNGDLDLLKRLLANQIPVIIEIGLDPPGEYQWLGWYGHYLLPVAYDDATQQIWVYDSWLGTSEVPQTNADPNGRVLSYADLEASWAQFNRSYIVLYEAEQEALVAELLGAALDDTAMWQASLARSQADAARDATNAFYWFNLGTTYNALGDYNKAATAFDQALAIGLPWRMLWYQFGPYEAYQRIGRYDDVVLLAETTLTDRPFFEESYYYLGLAKGALGDGQAARANLEKARELNPNFAPAEKALAELTPEG
jgi:hypothetical protein